MHTPTKNATTVRKKNHSLDLVAKGTCTWNQMNGFQQNQGRHQNEHSVLKIPQTQNLPYNLYFYTISSSDSKLTCTTATAFLAALVNEPKIVWECKASRGGRGKQDYCTLFWTWPVYVLCVSEIGAFTNVQKRFYQWETSFPLLKVCMSIQESIWPYAIPLQPPLNIYNLGVCITCRWSKHYWACNV